VSPKYIYALFSRSALRQTDLPYAKRLAVLFAFEVVRPLQSDF